ncbi:MAG: GGDEF domain-containing protein [Alphaproteobacteria bacterium]|nr:GGDEF domain-containing protein [Alphaproteobacteria bacterium]
MTTARRFMTQRPGEVYRFTGKAKYSRGTTPVVLQLQGRLAELEATLAQRTAQLRALAEEVGTDPLTGLKNRRAVEAALTEAATNWQRYGHRSAVLLLDLNGFKAINDTHGHAAGDAVLQHVAGLLTQATRRTDVVARLGGDEFVVVLREAETAAAIAKTRELRSVIETTPLVWGSHVLTVGASVGVATLAEAPQAAAVLALADARMYQFKQALRAARA